MKKPTSVTTAITCFEPTATNMMFPHWLDEAQDRGHSGPGDKKTTKVFAAVFLAFPVGGQTILTRIVIVVMV